MSGQLKGTDNHPDDPIRVINGVEMVDSDWLNQRVIEEVADSPKHLAPGVKAAREARETMSELLRGIGGEMEQFEAGCRDHLNTIRAKRIAVVSEATQMTNALKEVRQFFIGSDYKAEMERLSEFVALCERMQKLKDTGFLDRVADTMLNLAEGGAR